MKINERLIEVQAALHAPKNQSKQGLHYKYRNCDAILEAVKPLCKANGLLLTLSDSIEAHADRVYVKATATVSDGENQVSVSAFARETLSRSGLDDAQVTGGASSYARKYALSGLFCIDNTEADPDGMVHDKPKATAQTSAPTDRITLEYMAVFGACENLSELQKKFSEMYKANPKDRNQLSEAKDIRKKELS